MEYFRLVALVLKEIRDESMQSSKSGKFGDGDSDTDIAQSACTSKGRYGGGVESFNGES